MMGLLGIEPALSSVDANCLKTTSDFFHSLCDGLASTMDEAAEQIAINLAAQEATEGTIIVNGLMLEETYLYSQFSFRMKRLFDNYLVKHTKLQPVVTNGTDIGPGSMNLALKQGEKSGAQYLLSGSYFPGGDTIRISVMIIDIRTGKIGASVQVNLKADAAKSIDLKPANYNEVLSDRQIFGKSEIVESGLHLEAWTQLGEDNLLLEEGDAVVVYVRVNKPCYLRFIYHCANGMRVFPDPAYQNYYIDLNKVNKVIALPDTCIVSPPFGTETMQLFASTEKFPEITLVKKTVDGEEYDVIGEELSEVMIQTRGLKSKKQIDPKGSVERSEKRIQLTTVEKE